MEILDVTKIVGKYITTDENPWNEYIRYSEDMWMISMGESYEPHYDC